MFNNSYDHKEAQRQYEARICEAQECHAMQRQMIQQLAQMLTWFGKRLVTWSDRLQSRQTLEMRGYEGMGD